MYVYIRILKIRYNKKFRTTHLPQALCVKKVFDRCVLHKYSEPVITKAPRVGALYARRMSCQ